MVSTSRFILDCHYLQSCCRCTVSHVVVTVPRTYIYSMHFRGWDQTGSNGANLSFPKEFNITSEAGNPNASRNEWIVGVINAGQVHYLLEVSTFSYINEKQSLHRILPSWLLAHRPLESLSWSPRNSILLWHLLYYKCYRTRFGSNLASTSRELRTFSFLLSTIDVLQRFAVYYLDLEWAPKQPLRLSSPQKTHQLVFGEALSCLGSCGQVSHY